MDSIYLLNKQFLILTFDSDSAHFTNQLQLKFELDGSKIMMWSIS